MSIKVKSIIITLIFISAQFVYAGEAAFSVSTRTTATASSTSASGVTARVSTSFDVPSKYRNAFPRNSARFVQIPKLSVIETAKAAKKGSPMWAAYAAAVAAAGWAIDELTNQVVQTEMVPNSDPFTIPQDFYRWRIVSPYDISADTPQSLINLIGAYPSDNASIVFESSSRVRFRLYYIDSILYNSFFVNRESCESCQYDPVLVPVQNPVPQAQLDEALWQHFQNLPAHTFNEALSPNGNPLNVPEIAADLAQQFAEIAAANPNLAYDPATNTFTHTDPDTGEETSTQPDSAGDSNSLEIPDDYARENTQFEILTALQEFFQSDYELQPEEAVNTDMLDPNSSSFVYNPVLDQISTLPDLPDVIPLADFGIQSGSCQTIMFNWDGASVVFPSSDQCSKLNQLKQIMGWFLYVTTWFGVVYIIIGFRKVKAV